MSQPGGQGPEVQPTPTPANSGIPIVQGGNPAWNDVMQHIPEDKRQEVVPHFQKWDQHVNELNEKYSAWENFNKSGIDPEQVQYALQVASLIESQPQAVYDKIGEYLKSQGITVNGGQAVTEPQPTSAGTEGLTQEEFDLLKHPEYIKTKEQLDRVTQIMLQEHESRQQEARIQEQNAAFDKELAGLKSKHGEFDEGIEREITMRMIADENLTMEDAYNDVMSFIGNVRKVARPAYTPIGAGGSVPTQPIDPKKMNSKGVKDLVVQMLEQSSSG